MARPTSTRRVSFADRMKQHQIDWVQSGGLPSNLFESGRPWVLEKQHEVRNLYDPNWWSLLQGRAHRWARSLNSSQCFAVNVFAPFAADEAMARSFLRQVVPAAAVRDDERVDVSFEVVLPQTRAWLGEKRQPTQVDVMFTTTFEGVPTGRLLVEVKFTETGPGECRGAVAGDKASNPDPERCLELVAIRKSPATRCYLAEVEGRRYWEHIDAAGSPFDLAPMGPGEPCPFRHGLYQVMRNQALATAALAEEGLRWSEMALCIHADNAEVWALTEPVGGSNDTITAWAAITGGSSLLVIDPADVLAAAVEADADLANWQTWNCDRYDLVAHPPAVSPAPAEPSTLGPAAAGAGSPVLLGPLAERYAHPPEPAVGLWSRIKRGFAEFARRPVVSFPPVESGSTLAELARTGFQPFCRVNDVVLAVRGDDHRAEVVVVHDDRAGVLREQIDLDGEAVGAGATVLGLMYVAALGDDSALDDEEQLALITLARYLNLAAPQQLMAKRLALKGLLARDISEGLGWDERMEAALAALELGDRDRLLVARSMFISELHRALEEPGLDPSARARFERLARELGVPRDEVADEFALLDDALFALALSRGELPIEDAPPAQLKRGEICRVAVPVSVLQQKTRTTTRRAYAGTRVKLGGVPIYLGGSTPVRTSREVMESVGSGTLLVTDQRVLLVGAKLNYSIPLERILTLELFSNAVQINNEGARTGRFYKVEHPVRLHLLLGALTGRLVQ